MVVNELATIWMSSTAMDMPKHMAVKPIQIRTVLDMRRKKSNRTRCSTQCAGFKQPGPSCRSRKRFGRRSLLQIRGDSCAADGERRVFLTDAPRKNRSIQDRKYKGHFPLAEGQWQNRDLAGDDQIVGMAHKAIGTGAYQRRALQSDDPRRPIGTKRDEYPNARQLERDKQNKRQPVDGGIGGEKQDYRRQPRCMQHDDQWIVAAADLDRTACQQCSSIPLGIDDLDQA